MEQTKPAGCQNDSLSTIISIFDVHTKCPSEIKIGKPASRTMFFFFVLFSGANCCCIKSFLFFFFFGKNMYLLIALYLLYALMRIQGCIQGIQEHVLKVNTT